MADVMTDFPDISEEGPVCGKRFVAPRSAATVVPCGDIGWEQSHEQRF